MAAVCAAVFITASAGAVSADAESVTDPVLSWTDAQYLAVYQPYIEKYNLASAAYDADHDPILEGDDYDLLFNVHQSDYLGDLVNKTGTDWSYSIFDINGDGVKDLALILNGYLAAAYTIDTAGNPVPVTGDSGQFPTILRTNGQSTLICFYDVDGICSDPTFTIITAHTVAYSTFDRNGKIITILKIDYDSDHAVYNIENADGTQTPISEASFKALDSTFESLDFSSVSIETGTVLQYTDVTNWFS